MKRKVLYLIFANSTTSGGGHFYSLQTIIKILKNDINYKVINFGKRFVRVINDIENSSYVPIYKYNLLKHWKKLCKTVEDFAPDCIHAFDQKSLYIGRLLSLKLKIPIIYTKCGGPNGNTVVPFTDSIILFSKENYNFYKLHRTFINNVKYIPNRVIQVKPSISRIEKLKSTYNIDNKVNILRISRFDPYYRATLIQTYELFKRFRVANIPVNLILIGKIQNEDYFNEIEKRYGNDECVKLVTEDTFTNHASELLGLADIVVGTGRGAMEAASLNKIVFCPNKNSKLPKLMTLDSITKLLEFNLSERYSSDREEDLDVNMLMNSLMSQSTETTEIFKKYFDINAVKEKYISIYENSSRGATHLKNLFLQSLWFFKPK